jgi:hypothetical protein
MMASGSPARVGAPRMGTVPASSTKEAPTMGGIVGILVVVLIVLAIIYFARRT